MEPGYAPGNDTMEYRPIAQLFLKPGFHSNARNARKVLRKKKYASKLKSAQETQ